MSRFIVGLTGGKTTVANQFAALGMTIVDADVVARDVVAPGTPALQAIAEHFGSGVIKPDGQLDRAELRSLIFSNTDEKQWLNQLLHPLIRQQLLQQLAAATSPYVLLVAPLLIENGLATLVDQVLVVDVSPDTQQQRTQQRDQVSAAQVTAIMAAQCSREHRLEWANQVIQNEQDPQFLPAAVAKLHQNYLAMAAEKLAKSTT